MNKDDQINWGDSGAEFDYLGTSFSATRAGGFGVNFSGSTVGFERADQSSTWDGNFAPGAKLLWTGFDFGVAADLVFANPVNWAGAQF